jgi:hypothetical protein
LTQLYKKFEKAFPKIAAKWYRCWGAVEMWKAFLTSRNWKDQATEEDMQDMPTSQTAHIDIDLDFDNNAHGIRSPGAQSPQVRKKAKAPTSPKTKRSSKGKGVDVS